MQKQKWSGIFVAFFGNTGLRRVDRERNQHSNQKGLDQPRLEASEKTPLTKREIFTCTEAEDKDGTWWMAGGGLAINNLWGGFGLCTRKGTSIHGN